MIRLPLGAVACLAIASTACGAERFSAPTQDLKVEPVAKGVPVAGPVLHGDYVAWGEGGVEDGEPIRPIRVLSVLPGASPRVLYEQAPSRAEPEWWFQDFAGSPGGIGFLLAWSPCAPPSYDQCGAESNVVVGSHDRRFEPFTLTTEGCEHVRGPNEVDVEGARIAFGGEFCVKPCPPCWRLAIDDVADAKPPRTLVRSLDGFTEIKLAGGFVAGATWRKAVVYDLDAGRVSYRARFSNALHFDLQSDGKLVVVWIADESPRVAWFSPQEPWAHPVPIRPHVLPLDEEPGDIAIRLAADRLAFIRRISDKQSELVVTDLNGSLLARVADFDGRHPQVGDFDFDGKRVTWASQRVAAAKEECNAPPGYWQRECWVRTLGPTTVYRARIG